MNRLLAAGARVSRCPQHPAGAGTWFVEGSEAAPVLTRAAAELGVTVTPVAARPAGDSVPVAQARIGLVDEYGGSIPSGWIRWLLEQYEFPFEVVFPPMLDAGSLQRALRRPDRRRRSDPGARTPQPRQRPSMRRRCRSRTARRWAASRRSGRSRR